MSLEDQIDIEKPEERVSILQKIKALQDRVHFLLDFVEANSKREGEKIRCLWRQMSEFSFEVEETFNTHVVNQLLGRSQGETSNPDMIPAFNEDVDILILKIDLIKEELSVVTTEGEDVLLENLFKISLPSGDSQPRASYGQDPWLDSMNISLRSLTG